MGRGVKIFTYPLLGAIAFWGPDILWHAIRGGNIAGIDWFILSILLPLTTLSGFRMLYKLDRGEHKRATTALLMLFGIGVFGPLSMAVSLSFTGATFLHIGIWKFLIASFFMLPFYLLDMSTYDGTLLALVIATVLLTLFSFRGFGGSVSHHH